MPGRRPRSANEVLALVYDADTGALKTNATAIIVDSIDLNLDIRAESGDSVKISDGSTNLVINPDGSVNVVLPDMNFELSAADGDTVGISDGINNLAISSNGSISLNVPGFSTINVSGTVAIGTSSTQLLAANPNRLYVHFFNNDSVPVYIQYGSAAQMGRGIRLNVGAMLTLSGFDLFKGSITAISSTPSTLIDVLEGQ